MKNFDPTNRNRTHASFFHWSECVIIALPGTQSYPMRLGESMLQYTFPIHRTPKQMAQKTTTQMTA